ncbi:hypothetical protein CHS0354_005394 [Potamilus streckersoni]|uniref:RING-type domain-containing protein n=1 Tax=Potamilus streckersoni TaxID=2493646 RepID=A0AAE0SJD2_9BIVA|nr:hypothetical protein CHS0354_005394 [Potamilus streckersoni]
MHRTMAEETGHSYKQLNCPICLETFESPKVLACLHTFCEKCICRHASSLRVEGTRPDTILCPVCRSPTPAQCTEQTIEDWAAKLPTNAVIVSFLDSSKSNKDVLVYCQPCLTVSKWHISVAYCVTCSEYLCSNCYSCHKIFKFTMDHTISVHSMLLQQNLNSSQDDMYRCSLHWKKYKYICSDHKEFCCSDCAINDHRKCDKLMAIKDLSQSTKGGQEIKHISDNLGGLKKLFTTLLESKSQNLESIEHQRTEITKSVKAWSETIKQHIEWLEIAALEELDQMHKQESVTVSDEIIECKSAIAAIETSERILIDGTKSENELKSFITMTKISQHVLKYKEKYNTKETKSEVVELEFHRDRVCEGIINTLNSLGKTFRKACNIPRLSTISSTTENIPKKIQPNSMVTFSAKIPSDAKVCFIYSGVFLPDDRLVLSDVRNEKLKMFDKSFRCISSLKMKCPRHVCRVDHNTAAVTSGYNINLVSVSNPLTPLRSINVGYQCYGIASYQQNIIVDIQGDSLLTYDTSNKIISKIQSYDSLNSAFNLHCVSQDGHNIYYSTLNVIVTMDMKGNKLNYFENKDLRVASGLTVDKNGVIYCCGSKSKTVIQVTPEGRQLGVLLSSDDELQNPLGLCLNDRNDVILVFEGESNFVKVFRLI